MGITQRYEAYEWLFADILHTPPPMLAQLDLWQWERGCSYIDAVMRRQSEHPGGGV